MTFEQWKASVGYDGTGGTWVRTAWETAERLSRSAENIRIVGIIAGVGKGSVSAEYTQALYDVLDRIEPNNR